MKKKHESRAYQDEVFEATMNFLCNCFGNGVVAAPGGVGKSHIMNRVIKHVVTEWPGTRVMSIVHDAKVIKQNCNAMLNYWDNAPVGIYSSGLKSRDTVQPILYAGIQSVAKRAAEFGEVHLLIVDECDLVSPKEETLYQKFITDLKATYPGLRVLGFTATPFRLGMGCLTNSDLWDEIIIDLTKTDRFNWFIEEGYLSPLVTKKTIKEVDVTNIKMRGGEFDEKDMQEAADTEDLNRSVVDECVAYGADRKHWLGFASGIKHGHKLTKLFNARGIPTVMLSAEPEMNRVIGKDKDGNNLTYIQDCENKFRSGEIRCAINVGLFGRGWDFPALDMLFWVRPTQSVALWIQGNVRLSRTAEGKTNGLVLDFCGNTRRLGPVNDPVVPTPRRKGDAAKGEAPVKECPQCHSYLHTRTMICPDCQYVFPPPKSIQKTASSDEILKKGSKASHIAQIDDFYVQAVRYKPTLSKRGQYYLKVTYSVGTANFQESLFFDSTSSWAKKRIQTWWEHRGGKLPIPEGVDEASDRSGELLIPTVIRVDTAGQYPQVVGVDFDEDAKTSDDIEEDPF